MWRRVSCPASTYSAFSIRSQGQPWDLHALIYALFFYLQLRIKQDVWQPSHAVDGVREFRACVLVQRPQCVLDYVFCTVCMHACMHECRRGQTRPISNRSTAQFMTCFIYIMCVKEGRELYHHNNTGKTNSWLLQQDCNLSITWRMCVKCFVSGLNL